MLQHVGLRRNVLRCVATVRVATCCTAQPADAPMLPSYWASASPLSFLPPIRALPDSMASAMARHALREEQTQRRQLAAEQEETASEIQARDPLRSARRCYGMRCDAT
jgi:hypothetical protein